MELGIHDIDADYIEELRALGYNDISVRQLVEAGIHDVSPDYIKSLNNLGFKDIPIRQLIELSIHNVTISFIKKIRDRGLYKNLTLDDYRDLKIHGIDKKMKRQE